MEAKIKVYHNPRCSKSRNAINELTERGVDFEVFEYLKEELSPELIKNVLAKLKMSATELLRKGEADYKEHVKNKDLSESQIIDLMVEFPKLIERPIVIKGENAIIARPLEKINTLI